ncbi:[acyl-carrier-protein] S-malonyltransferase [candidate division KSB1 bacterium 4572_119]|nr:MAG: [acyl-carrier-protein] S-malonyltransferase [candidate division KSB1 bacterium 4572_119]
MAEKRAFLFPGQASQYVGMGKDIYEAKQYPIAKEVFDLANDLLGFDITSICFNGPEEQLKQTKITQPAIFIHSYIINKILAEKNVAVDVLAGHSLGEYSALVAANSMSFEDGLKAVKKRGELMQAAGEEQPGTMAAIIGLTQDEVVKICDTASAAGIVQPANFNSLTQIAISGSISGVERAMELARKEGAQKVIPLVVSGAFHSPLMESAQVELKKELDSISINNAEFPVYANVTAKPVNSEDEIRELLFKQLTYPVRWVETIQNMLDDGVKEFYEVGPGKVLSGLVKRINRRVTIKVIGTVDDLEKI